MAYIYKITNDINNKVYIGQTIKKLKYRLQEHFHKAEWDCAHQKKLTHFSQAIITHGKEHFHIELIEECDLTVIDERERYWIAYYDSYHSGYNMTIGGQDQPLNKGKPVLQYDLQGNYIQTFESAFQAANSTGLCDETIRQACRQIRPGAGGYQWRYFSTNFPLQIAPLKNYQSKKKRKVNQFNLRGELINSFDSLQEAAQKTNINSTNIGRVCRVKGKAKAGGFQWRFSEDDDIPQNIEKQPKKNIKQSKTKYSVIQYDKQHNFIKEWTTIKEAADTLGIRSDLIINVCENKQKTAGNFFWQYKI